MKKFSTISILTNGTGILCGDIGDAYLMAEYITGEKGIMTHMLPDCGPFVQEHLRKELPNFSDIFAEVLAITGGDSGDFLAKLAPIVAEFEAKHGKMHSVPKPNPLPKIHWGTTLTNALSTRK